MKSGVIIIGIVLLVLVLLLAGGVGMMGGYGGGGMMSGYGFSPVGGILTALFWGIVICGIALVAAWLAHNNDHIRMHAGPGESPLQILKTRYARGEITKEQFDEIKRDLGES